MSMQADNAGGRHYATTYTFEVPAPDHQPQLYRPDLTAQHYDGFAAVDAAARARYREDGFLVIRNAFDAAAVQSALDELHAMAAAEEPDCANVCYEGHVRRVVEQLAGRPFDSLSVREQRSMIATIPIGERERLVRKFMGFTKGHAALKAVSDAPELLRLVGTLMGEAPRVSQSMALVKPPRGREKPWHQDHAYFDFPVDTPIVGVWIALQAVTPQNGCMFVLAGGHRSGPRVHFAVRDWQLCDTDVIDSPMTALPMEAGDLMIFDGKIPHGTPTNRTDEQRWALQYHYVPKSATTWSPEERLAVFGSEGKDASC